MQWNGRETLISLFAARIDADGDQPALHVKRGDSYEALTWNEVGDDVRRTAAALARLGARPGDRVIQFSENRYEWIVCDLAIQLAQAIHVPVHAPLTGEQAAVQIGDCGAQLVLLSNVEQAAKLARCADQLDNGLQFFSFEPCKARFGAAKVQLLAEAKADLPDRAGVDLQQRALDAITPDSLATILYTSGTTGEPKGVMLNQRNLTTNTLATLEAFSQERADLRMCFLPLSHIFARTCDLYTWIAVGSELALAESRDTVVADCVAVKPSLLNGVPYFFERVQRHLIDQGRADEKGSLREFLGGRMRLCCSGGAALPEHVYEFWEQRGVPILQGYGLTETSPVISASTTARTRKGCVGPPISGVEVRIADDGEVLTKGPHVMVGYYKNQAATDEIIKDGWLHTGDLGALEEDGLLRITGRKKEIIVTAAGKNVAPVLLETLLTEDPLIVQAVVIGDDRNYLAALIVPDPDHLKAEMSKRKIRVLSKKGALKHPKVRALYENCIQQRLSQLSHYEQVRTFVLLDRGFTIESGEMTPKLSLRRKVIERNFAAEIEQMFEST